MHSVLVQLIASLIRSALIVVGTWLIDKGLIDREGLDAFLSETTTWILGIVLTIISIVWTWAKLRFNRETVNKALNAPASVSANEVATEVKEQHKFTMSV